MISTRPVNNTSSFYTWLTKKSWLYSSCVFASSLLGVAPSYSDPVTESQESSVSQQPKQTSGEDPKNKKVNLGVITKDPKAFLELYNLVTQKAPLTIEDEKVEENEALDYFLNSQKINTNREGAAKDVIDMSDNWPLLIRMRDIEIKIVAEDPSVPQDDVDRIADRIRTTQEVISSVIKKTIDFGEFPQIEKHLILKKEAKKLVDYVHKKAKDAYETDPQNVHKKEFYEHIDLYVQLFNDVDENDLWINLEDTLCASTYRLDGQNKITKIYPQFDHETMTMFANCFSDKDIQTLFYALIYKESIHLERLQSGCTFAFDANIDFTENVKKFSKDEEVIIPPESQERIVESARWFVASTVHEEYIAYKAMYEWLKKHGLDANKLLILSKRFEGLLPISNACGLARNHMLELADENGQLDEKKFEKWFLENKEEAFDKGIVYYSDMDLAITILKEIHESQIQRGLVSKDTSHLAFLDDPKYCNPQEYPKELKAEKKPPEPVSMER